MLELIHSLYAYNTWANQRLFETAGRLTPEQFLGQGHATFGTLRDVLLHLVDVEQMWLARARGQPNPASLSADLRSVADIRAAWQVIDAAMHQFIGGLGERDLQGIARYTNLKGEPQAYPLWQLLFHQANHAQQHRSEAALVMTGMGQSTGWLDYLIYVDEMRLRKPTNQE
jgi:uncharacterized damage-inducible protein DinB